MRLEMREFLKLSAALLAWLLVFDLVLSGVGAVASRAGGPGLALARYLEYGRSIEGKLAQLIGHDGRGTNAIVSAGWLDPQQWKNKASRAKDEQHKLVAVYGQSFANQVSIEAAHLHPSWQLRTIAAPAAPLSHSYAAYQLDKDLRKADVVVVGVLASALAHSSSLSGLSFTFESPAPYTYPRYTLSPQGLVMHEPLVSTEAQFRAAFSERGETWHRFEQQLMAANPSMDRFQLKAWWGDASALVRLCQRGWASAQVAQAKSVLGEQGLPAELLAEIDVAKAQLLSLQQETKSRGEKLVILLLHDQGYDHALTKAFGSFFRDHQIAVVDSSDVVDSKNPSNFIADGHFNASSNAKLGRALAAAAGP
jgi:hypothetical protein